MSDPPASCLVRPCLDDDVAPSRVEGHHRDVVKHNVVGAGVEVAQPPRLVHSLFAQQRQQRSTVLLADLADLAVFWDDDGGVRLGRIGGIADVMVRPVAVPSAIQAISAASPIRQLRSS